MSWNRGSRFPARAEEIPAAILCGSPIDAVGKVPKGGCDARPQDALEALIGLRRSASVEHRAFAGHRDVSLESVSLQCPGEASSARELAGASRKKGAKKG